MLKTTKLFPLVLVAGAVLTVTVVRAAPPAKPAPRPAAKPAPAGLRFTDVTAKAGIRFSHNSGRAGKKFLPETLGAGGAFFDANGDGWLDVLLVNSKDWTPKGRKSLHALYRNNKNG